MVASPHYLASLAGVQTLERGGSAADAAISVNAVLSVVYPHMTGLGGDALWLLYDAESQSVSALNGSGRAARAASTDYFTSRGMTAIPPTGPLSAITVPGAVDSWQAASSRFGRLSWGDLLAPAIKHAREGFPTSDGVARFTTQHGSDLRSHPMTSRTFLPNGRLPAPGDITQFAGLAETLETVAAKGRDGFYSGWVAEDIVSDLQAAGGLLTMGDFEEQASEWADPVQTTYRDITCYQHPPNSQGVIHLLMLNILEGFDLRGMGDGSAEYLHVMVEAAKLAYIERDRHVTDPDYAESSIETLLSKQYADQLRSKISLDRTMPSVAPSDPHGDTTCTVVVDKNGNAASVIQSICHAFGSAFVAGRSGVLLHNRGSKFSLRDDHINRLEPRKRTMHTLMPGMALRDGRLHLVYGTMGGDGQPQTNTSTITKIVDFDHSVQSAVDAPRALHGQFWGKQTDDLWIEERFPDETLRRLGQVGQHIRPVEEWADMMGHAQVIAIDHDRGITLGGSDPRGDGLALGD